jgi:hypothetical protein
VSFVVIESAPIGARRNSDENHPVALKKRALHKSDCCKPAEKRRGSEGRNKVLTQQTRHFPNFQYGVEYNG